jgi:hypothetical protein
MDVSGKLHAPPVLPPEYDPPISTGRVPELDLTLWTREKILPLLVIKPGLPALSPLLYRLSYPGSSNYCRYLGKPRNTSSSRADHWTEKRNRDLPTTMHSTNSTDCETLGTMRYYWVTSLQFLEHDLLLIMLLCAVGYTQTFASLSTVINISEYFTKEK